MSSDPPCPTPTIINHTDSPTPQYLWCRCSQLWQRVLLLQRSRMRCREPRTTLSRHHHTRLHTASGKLAAIQTNSLFLHRNPPPSQCCLRPIFLSPNHHLPNPFTTPTRSPTKPHPARLLLPPTKLRPHLLPPLPQQSSIPEHHSNNTHTNDSTYDR